MLYDFSKCDNYIEAILADYIDCTTDEQLKESISLCFRITFLIKKKYL